jgi:hypothetical protein
MSKTCRKCKELEDECDGYLEGMLLRQAERDELWAVLRQFVCSYETGGTSEWMDAICFVVQFVDARQRRLDQQEKLLVMELTARAEEKG